MGPEEAIRQPALIKEELQDLLAYLGALPPSLKRNGAFASYEQRVAELSRELMMSEMFRLAPELTAHTGASPSGSYGALQWDLLATRRRYSLVTSRWWLATRITQGAIVLVSMGSIAAAGAMTGALSALHAVPLAMLTAVLGALVWLVTDNARKAQRRAELLDALCQEVAHSLGPQGELLGPAEYYPASTRRIEQLLTDIQRESVSAGVAVRGA